MQRDNSQSYSLQCTSWQYVTEGYLNICYSEYVSSGNINTPSEQSPLVYALRDLYVMGNLELICHDVEISNLHKELGDKR